MSAFLAASFICPLLLHADAKQCQKEERSALIEGDCAKQLFAKISQMQVEARGELGVENPLSKPALVIFTASWCRYCQEMERDFLQNSSFLQLDKHLTLVKLELTLASEMEKKKIKNQFSIHAIPTFCLFTKEGKEIMRWNLPKKKAEAFSDEILRLLDKE